jgi:BirA family transcriptional regulator, biotin operon repressor / biotin---[acetyl-CoA-carboxylase] ligase
MIFSAPEFCLEVVEECTSTNEVLLARRERADFPGSALLSLRQSAGYGRRGQEWWSGEGNLALSVALRLPLGGAHITLLPFFAGLALMDVLGPLIPAGAVAQLKWPNDLYLQGRKLSGLIAQARQSGEHTDVVLGVGVNLAEAPPGLDAIALSEVMDPPRAEEFAADFLRALHARLHSVEDFSALRASWEKAARLREVQLRVVGREGIFRGVQLLPTGELEVQDEGGALAVLASEEVSLRLL